jgi:hypothetical protein
VDLQRLVRHPHTGFRGLKFRHRGVERVQLTGLLGLALGPSST